MVKGQSNKGTSKGTKGRLNDGLGNGVVETIQDIISKEMLVFSTEEAGWILDITHDYINMIQHTRARQVEMKKSYEQLLSPDAQLPEGVTAQQLAEDLESMKQDAIHLDIAEKRTTIIRDAARDFIMTDTQDEGTESDSESESTVGHEEVNHSDDEQLHTVSEEDTHVLPEQEDTGSVLTVDTENT